MPLFKLKHIIFSMKYVEMLTTTAAKISLVIDLGWVFFPSVATVDLKYSTCRCVLKQKAQNSDVWQAVKQGKR